MFPFYVLNYLQELKFVHFFGSYYQDFWAFLYLILGGI